MRYIANPVEVEAHIIVAVHLPQQDGSVPLTLSINGEAKPAVASKEMCARMKPFPGDYWVVQEDGYIYLNPKDVFERKYSPRREPEKTVSRA